MESAVQTLLTELRIRFGEVNQRLDRMDATLTNDARQLSAGARSIAGLAQWTAKAEVDRVRVPAELADLKTRIAKLESR